MSAVLMEPIPATMSFALKPDHVVAHDPIDWSMATQDCDLANLGQARNVTVIEKTATEKLRAFLVSMQEDDFAKLLDKAIAHPKALARIWNIRQPDLKSLIYLTRGELVGTAEQNTHICPHLRPLILLDWNDASELFRDVVAEYSELRASQSARAVLETKLEDSGKFYVWLLSPNKVEPKLDDVPDCVWEVVPELTPDQVRRLGPHVTNTEALLRHAQLDTEAGAQAAMEGLGYRGDLGPVAYVATLPYSGLADACGKVGKGPFALIKAILAGKEVEGSPEDRGVAYEYLPAHIAFDHWSGHPIPLSRPVAQAFLDDPSLPLARTMLGMKQVVFGDATQAVLEVGRRQRREFGRWSQKGQEKFKEALDQALRCDLQINTLDGMQVIDLQPPELNE